MDKLQMVDLNLVLKAIDEEKEFPGDMPDVMKQAMGGNTTLIQKALRSAVSLTKRSIQKRIVTQIEASLPGCGGNCTCDKTPKPFKIELYQQDWTPGFAAFNDDGSIQAGAPAHISLDIGAFMSILDTEEISKQDLPYVIADSIMHEIIHALESWASVEFNEEKVEGLLDKYREKYRNTPPPVSDEAITKDCSSCKKKFTGGTDSCVPAPVGISGFEACDNWEQK